MRGTFTSWKSWKVALMEWDEELEGEHGGKEHGPIDPAVSETDPSEDDVGFLGGGGPAATLDTDEDPDELDDRPDSAL